VRVLGALLRALCARLWRAARDLWEPIWDPIWDPFTPPEDLEVLPCDWTAALNSFRQYLGYPPYTGPACYPTIEQMEEWERAFPGATASFRRCARIEAEMRWLRAQRATPQEVR